MGDKEEIQQGVFVQKDETQNYTLAVVWRPNKVDTQGQFMNLNSTRRAAWQFMDNLVNKRAHLGVQHADIGPHNGRVVESFIAPADMIIGSTQVYKGDWLVGAVWSDEVFARIKNGELTGYSMGGKADLIMKKRQP